MDRVSPGDPLRVTAADWNAVADLVNAAAAAPVPLARRLPASPPPPLDLPAFCASGTIAPGRAVRLVSVPGRPGDDPGALSAPAAARVSDDFSDWAPGEAWGVVVQGVSYDAPGRVRLSGAAFAQVTDDAAPAVAPDARGDLAPAAAGASVLAAATGTGGQKWALVLLPPAAPNQEASTTGTFVIDRTDGADDQKAWDPANAEPQDWAAYAAVELITQVARFTSGGSIEFAKFSQIWSAMNAPVILAATTDAAGTTCEDEE